MIPPLRSFDDVDGKERGQKKTDDLRTMTALGPRTLQRVNAVTDSKIDDHVWPLVSKLSLCTLITKL